MILYGNKIKKFPMKDNSFIGNTDETQRKIIDTIYRAGRVESLKNVLNGFTLDDFQTMLGSIAYTSKKFLVGADTGLGKSLIMALYLKIHEAKETLNEDSKCLITTTSASLNQIKSVVENSTGMRVKEIPGDSNKLLKELQKGDFGEYDIYIVSHSVFGKAVDFNRLFAYLIPKINIFILDESMTVANPTSLVHMSIKYWFEDVEYKLFLNATVIEKKLEQLYYQFLLLEPDLLPPLTDLKRKHEMYQKIKGKKFAEFKGYKDLDKLLNSIPYHYCNIDRTDLGITFETEDILVPLQMTPLQAEVQTSTNYWYALFSPTTQKDTEIIPFDVVNLPALRKTVEIVGNELKEKGGGIVIYAEPVNCKEVLKRTLLSYYPNIRVGIIDGQTVDKDETRKLFNSGDIHVLIINIPEALDLATGKTMIMYTIPSKHYQARARIMRGLETGEIPKRYYYLIYLNSYQSFYVKNTMLKDELTLSGALGRDIKTARTLSKKLKELEKHITLNPQIM